MIRLPLFGKDSSPQYTAPRIAAIGTLIVWIILLLVMIFVPVKKPPKYETVKIVLEPLPETKKKVPEKTETVAKSNKQELAQKTESEAAPLEKPVEKKTEQKVEKPAQEKPAQKEAPAPVKEQPKLQKTADVAKAAPKQETPKDAPKQAAKPAETVKPKTPAKTEVPKTEQKAATPPKLVKSVEQLMEEQAAAKKNTPKDFNWDFFDDDDSPEVPASSSNTSQNTGRKMDSSEALSGNAGTTTASQSQRQTSATAVEKPVKDNSVSGSTSELLNKIAETSYSSNNEGAKSVAMIRSAKATDGAISMEMEDGTRRRLVSPKNPKIDISPENAKLINGSPTVTISFTVHMSGNVPQSEIEIRPASLLPQAVQNEIKAQVSTWLFEKANVASQASFKFTIERK